MTGYPSTYNIGIQTDMSSLQCLRCNSNLNSPTHTSSPYLIKLKSSDSVISETKSSVSDFTNLNDKTFTPSKKEDLMVNPILGHHRLCEHTKGGFNYEAFTPKKGEVIKENEPLIAKLNGTENNNNNNNIRNRDKLIDEKASPENKTNVYQTPSALSHGPGNGSNNSLWSKTSSKEGAKLFENFNRNLIKSIRVCQTVKFISLFIF
jgi:hypothetical protein